MKTAKLNKVWIALSFAFTLAMMAPSAVKAGTPVFVINELDCDQAGTDAGEFVEIYDGGVGNSPLDGYVIVFFNGSDTVPPADGSYQAFDLDGKTTDANGYFLLANVALIPTPGATNMVFPGNTLQQGQDAVALYLGDAANFPNDTAPTLTGLVDAIVYDTADPDDPGLLVLLNAGQPQIDENANGTQTTDSIYRCPNGAGGQRNSTNYVTGVPTPGAANTPSCPPSGVTGACCLLNETCQRVTPAQCDTLGGAFQGFDEVCYPQRCGPTGACCQPWGVCEIRTPDECAASNGVYQGDGTTCSPTNPCPAVMGACCTGGACAQSTRSACQAAGKIFLGEGVSCTGACPPDYSNLLINEIRTRQDGTDDDDYFEIVNTGGTPRSLNGLTYIVIGDNLDTPQPSNSGFIESVTDLSGLTIPAGGHFLVANQPVIFDHAGVPMLNAVPDFVAPFNFEDSDNATHLLVSGFYGTNGQDLDTGTNDCLLDSPQPWAAVIDKVATVSDTNIPPTTTECHYGSGDPSGDTIGPDGIFSPSHIFRLPDASTMPNAWTFRVDEFFPNLANDTPGQVNALSTGACCSGTDCTIETQQVCVEAIEGNWKGRDVACGVGNVVCQGACCYCTDTDPWCETWDCVFTDQETCTNPGGIYKGTFQGDGILCPPNPGAIDCTPTLTIAGARALFTGTPVGARIGPVRLSSKTNLISSGSATFEIQDLSGTDGQSGLTVFGTTAILNSQFGAIAEGDMIDIQGTLQLFNGVLELANSNVRALALVHNYSDNQAVPPISIPGADFQNLNPTAEDRESELVKLDCVLFVNPPAATFAANTNYTVTDGTDTVTVRIVTATPALDLIGATIPTGPCSLTGIFSQSDGATPFDSNYRLLPRMVADIGTATCTPPGLWACCVGGGACRDDLPQSLCEGLGGNFFVNQTCLPTPPSCLTADTVRINEIRMEQPGTDNDEYFELKGTSTVPLGTLTYIVIGDNPSGNSGVIESVTPLTGEKIPADGVFLAARSTYSLGGTPDLTTTTINFENDDNMTHMIVENFTGTNGQDLDTPDDGTPDTTPWDSIVDSVSIIKTTTPVPGVDEYSYSATTVGPAGNVSPYHVLRCPPSDAWVPGTEETNTNDGNDTPGAVNPNVCPCSCPADRNADGKVNGQDVSNFAKMILGQIAIDPCADINQDGVVNYTDTSPFVDLVLQSQSCSGDFATGVRVVSYNLLQYNGGASAARKAAFKRVLNAILPDVLAVQELSGGGATDFLNNVLNAADGPSPGGYALASYTSGGEALYYRTAKITYAAVPVDGVDFGSVATTPRPTPWRKLGVAGGNPANDFYVYNTHLKAGTAAESDPPTPTNPDIRDTAAILIRADADTRNGAQVILAGDFNFYSSNSPAGAEPAWSTLTVAGDVDGQMADPISVPGAWNGNGTFAAVHTQSPHANNNTPASPVPSGAIGGGMDSRFDFVLINATLQDAVGLSYLAGTYKAYGNDGLHFNNDINDAPVIPEGSIIADSLHMAADHIPVVMELKINP